MPRYTVPDMELDNGVAQNYGHREELPQRHYMLNYFIDFYLAEGEGFEPPGGCPPLVFKTRAINRTLPPLREKKPLGNKACEENWL